MYTLVVLILLNGVTMNAHKEPFDNITDCQNAYNVIHEYMQPAMTPQGVVVVWTTGTCKKES